MNGFIVNLLFEIPDGMKDFELFLRDNRQVKDIRLINDDNEVFCTQFQYLVETTHESERAYIAFIKGLKETFPIRKMLDLQVM